MLARRLCLLTSLRGWAARGLATEPSSQGDQVLSYWRALLLGDHHGQQPNEGPAEQSHVKELLATAIRLRQGRAQSTLPEQLVAVFMQYYTRLDRPGRLRLLQNLTADFGVQRPEVDAAMAAWQQAAGGGTAGAEEALPKAAQRLAAAAQPLYTRLFVPIGQQPCGIKFLVDLRAEVLDCARAAPSGAAPLRALGEALRGALAEWFSVGLLQLRRLTWEATPAALLEKVMEYEAVHRMAGWADLRQRLGPARRVFAFFHQAMPDEPLVVLHTALVRGPPAASMAQILTGEGDSPGEPTTAVFYSISSTQKGLAGVDLGNFLIKQVAHCLLGEFPTLRTLCTLSPLPGLADWLDMRIARGLRGLDLAPLLLPAEAERLALLAAGRLPAAAAASAPAGDSSGSISSGGGGDGGSPQAAAAMLLQWCLQEDRWLGEPELEAALRPAMLRLAAVYLVREKRRGLALDPVANFHLRNGAQLWRLNWRADTSTMGLSRSHGIMVNYMYDLEEVAANNRRYLVDGEVVAGSHVLELLEEIGQQQQVRPAAAVLT